MKEFTFSDLSRRLSEILDAAIAEPVSLVERGKAKLVMMPMTQFEQYQRLVAQARAAAQSGDGQTAFMLKNAPQSDIDNLLKGFQEVIDEAERETAAIRPVPKSSFDDLRDLSDVEIDLHGPLKGDDE
jgi:hypothetical protein